MKIKKAPGLEKTNELQEEIKKLKEELKLEQKKSKKIGKTNIQAVRDLINNSKDLVKYISPGYSSIGDVDYEDLISEGNISLLKAIDKFDTSSKSCLATYSGIWIRTYIKSFINKSQFIEQNPTAG